MMQVKIFKSEVTGMFSLNEQVNEFLYKAEYKTIVVETKIVQGFPIPYGVSSAYVIIVVSYEV